MISREEVFDRFGFDKPGALYSDADAEVNPFRLTHAVVADMTRRGLRVYEDTEVTSFEFKTDRPEFRTTQGYSIRARHAVFAFGYETQELMPAPGTRVGCSYAFATDPVKIPSSWENRALIWETARPYMYLRTTADNRVLVGGHDGKVADGPGRDEHLIERTDRLRQALVELFPSFESARIAYRWAAALCTTNDGIPLFGRHPRLSHCYLALGYGGSGTVYNMIASLVIRDLITTGHHSDEVMFQPSRARWYKVAARTVERVFTGSAT